MRTIVFVGLGNPGKKYKGTRHNLGIEVLRVWFQQAGLLATMYRDWQAKATGVAMAEFTTPASAGETVHVYGLFPETGMNNSGQVIAAFLREQGLSPEAVIVLHDDIELPLGKVALASSGSAKGHNGVRSVQEYLSTQAVSRMRLGIGRPMGEQAVREYVLEPFPVSDRAALEALKQAAGQALSLIANEGWAAAWEHYQR
ncbi:MAG: aminoacyl-tRNA hydrolase [Candidatus Andersenbacteria bacterium]